MLDRLHRLLALLALGSAAFAPALNAQSPPREYEPPPQDSVWTIGVLDGDAAEIFGAIVDVELGDRGDVFVLDRQALELRWFDPRGGFVAAAGRRGEGPGEFRAPFAMLVADDGTVRVLDAALRRITVFSAAEGRLERTGEVSFAVNALDFCRHADRYYMLAPAEDALVAVLAATGETLETFGRAAVEVPAGLENHSEFLRNSQNRGRILCTPEVLVVVRDQHPRVTALTYDGQLLWEATLADFHERTWISIAGGQGVRMGTDPETGKVHNVQFATLLGADTVAISLSISSEAGVEADLDVRLLSLADGHELRREALPFAVVARRGGWTYGLRHHPFPQIAVRRDRQGG